MLNILLISFVESLDNFILCKKKIFLKEMYLSLYHSFGSRPTYVHPEGNEFKKSVTHPCNGILCTYYKECYRTILTEVGEPPRLAFSVCVCVCMYIYVYIYIYIYIYIMLLLQKLFSYISL